MSDDRKNAVTRVECRRCWRMVELRRGELWAIKPAKRNNPLWCEGSPLGGGHLAPELTAPQAPSSLGLETP